MTNMTKKKLRGHEWHGEHLGAVKFWLCENCSRLTLRMEVPRRHQAYTTVETEVVLAAGSGDPENCTSE